MHGEISRGDAQRVSGLKERTARAMPWASRILMAQTADQKSIGDRLSVQGQDNTQVAIFHLWNLDQRLIRPSF